MLEKSLPTSVNHHYLDKVMELSEEMEIEATEDILDARGMKLVAKGAKISRNLQEKLIIHKLRKPLESSISVAAGVDIGVIVKEAKRISETIEPIGHILRAESNNGLSPLKILAEAKFGNAMSMMLTIIEKGGARALEHSVMVSLLSICLAKKMHLSERDQTVAAIAGLLHDIGELYIEPQYLSHQKRLLPYEWRHVVVHPRIGQMLISELENYPAAVSLAVSEHHERFDGTGYPSQVSGKNISPAGQVISVAEMISGVFMKHDKPLERAELALKIMPGEHAHNLVSAISSTLRLSRKASSAETNTPPENAGEGINNLFNHIAMLLKTSNALVESSQLQSKKAKTLALQALQRIMTIQRAFSSTGLDTCLNSDAAFFETSDGEILFEAAVASKEIQWRLRDAARDFALHTSQLEAHETSEFQPLILLLDEVV